MHIIKDEYLFLPCCTACLIKSNVVASFTSGKIWIEREIGKKELKKIYRNTQLDFFFFFKSRINRCLMITMEIANTQIKYQSVIS